MHAMSYIYNMQLVIFPQFTFCRLCTVTYILFDLPVYCRYVLMEPIFSFFYYSVDIEVQNHFFNLKILEYTKYR